MSEIFPPNVVLFVREKLRRRKEYQVALEQTEEYIGFDDFKQRRNQEKRKMLQDAITNLTHDVIQITRIHFPSIRVDANEEITISNILALLPPPEKVVSQKIFHAQQ